MSISPVTSSSSQNLPPVEEKKPIIVFPFDQFPEEVKVVVMGFLSVEEMLAISTLSKELVSIVRKHFSASIDQAFARKAKAVADLSAEPRERVAFYIDIMRLSTPERVILLLPLALKELRNLCEQTNYSMRSNLKYGHDIVSCAFQINKELASNALREVLETARNRDFIRLIDWLILLDTAADLAPDLFNEVLQFVQPQHFWYHDVPYYLVPFYLSKKRFDEARTLCQVLQLNALEAFEGEWDERELALTILTEVREAIRGFGDLTKKLIYLKIAEVQCQLDASDELEETLTLFHAIDEMDSMDDEEIELLTMVYNLEEQCDLPHAVVTLETILEKSTPPPSNSYLIGFNFRKLLKLISSPEALEKILATFKDNAESTYSCKIFLLEADPDYDLQRLKSFLLLPRGGMTGEDLVSKNNEAKAYFALVNRELRTDPGQAYQTASLITYPFLKAYAYLKIALLSGSVEDSIHQRG